jgi:SAM-dependent methyltransferase
MTPGEDRAAGELWRRLMCLQTDLAQPLELACFFNSPAWDLAVNVLDAGTGNAYYLRRLAAYFPDKRYIGIDTDRDHIAEAARGLTVKADDGPAVPIELAVADVLQLRTTHDAILARLLIQHLPSITQFLESMQRAVRPGGVLIVIESSDERRRFVPALPSLTAFFEAFRAERRAGGCDRDAGQALVERVGEFGFAVEASTMLTVPSTLTGHKDLFLHTYLTVLDVVRTNFHLRWDYEKVAAELRMWAASPRSYTQLGVHVACYRRQVTPRAAC